MNKVILLPLNNKTNKRLVFEKDRVTVIELTGIPAEGKFICPLSSTNLKYNFQIAFGMAQSGSAQSFMADRKILIKRTELEGVMQGDYESFYMITVDGVDYLADTDEINEIIQLTK